MSEINDAKRRAQNFMSDMALTWQANVRQHGGGAEAEKHRAMLLGALRVYRYTFNIHDVSSLTLLDTYRRFAQEQLDDGEMKVEAE